MQQLMITNIIFAPNPLNNNIISHYLVDFLHVTAFYYDFSLIMFIESIGDVGMLNNALPRRKFKCFAFNIKNQSVYEKTVPSKWILKVTECHYPPKANFYL